MGKHLVKLLLLSMGFILFSMDALAVNDAEKQLLKSWGIQLDTRGRVNYTLSESVDEPVFWVSSPAPKLEMIDYSSTPTSIEPLIIYKR